MLKQKLASRKLWAAIATAIFIVLSKGLDMKLPEDVYWNLVALASSYIFGEALVDVNRPRK
jgi:hypothetical protein